MSTKHQRKCMFITGGVVSSLGKGIVAASVGALLEDRGRQLWLIVQRLEDDAMPAVRRLMRLRDRPPHLPVRIIDYSADGRVWMDATLSGYAPLSDAGREVWVARRFVLRWPQRQAEMRLDLLKLRTRSAELPFCTFPKRFNGQIEVLDEPADGR